MSRKTSSNASITSTERHQGIQLVYADGQILQQDRICRPQLPSDGKMGAFDFIVKGFALAGASYYATPDYPPSSGEGERFQTAPVPAERSKTPRTLGAAFYKVVLRMMARGRERRAAEDARRYLLAREEYLLRDIGLTRWDLQAGWPRGRRGR